MFHKINIYIFQLHPVSHNAQHALQEIKINKHQYVNIIQQHAPIVTSLIQVHSKYLVI